MAGQRLTDKTALEEQAGSGDLLMLVDVNDTTGSSAGTSKKTDFKYVIQTDKYSLNNTEVQALSTTSKTLVGALSGYMPTIYNVTVLCTYAANTESSNVSLYLGYDDSQTILYWDLGSRFMGAKSADASYQFTGHQPGGGVDAGMLINKPFKMWSNAAFNGGWSCDVYVTYAYTKII
tara:strand:+ start:10827 stop:11357 length:531 start_codon:yes stop_codon:yes gene_type:complete